MIDKLHKIPSNNLPLSDRQRQIDMTKLDVLLDAIEAWNDELAASGWRNRQGHAWAMWRDLDWTRADMQAIIAQNGGRP
jgi:hypothetical protein